MKNFKNKRRIIFPLLYFNQKIFLIFSLISYCNTITSEIKIFSTPYISLKNRFRKMSTQDIFGSAFKINYYYTNLYLGEKQKKQSYILDTGSSITTSTCKQTCQKCGKHINPYHNIKNMNNILTCNSKKCSMVTSQCEKNKKCTFSISYAEGSSLKGTYINELINFGKNYKKQKGIYAPIGCTSVETHLFLTQEADGIMGLSNNEKNFVDILYNLGGINNKIFGLCFGQLGGYFSIGNVEKKFHKEKIKFVEMKNNNKYFEVNINNITVNNIKIKNYDMSKFSNFLDSGTTLSFFPNVIYDEVISVFDSECKKFGYNKCGKYEYVSDSGACYIFDNYTHLNNAIKNFWPTITFFINDYEFKWKPEYYFFNISEEKNRSEACIGFCKGGSWRFTFGSTWFIGHDIIFDRENKLIGFAEAECFQNLKINETNGLEIFNINILEKLGKNKIIYLCVISSIVLLTGMTLIIIVLVIFHKKMKVIDKIRKSKADGRKKISDNSSGNNNSIKLSVVNISSDENKNNIALKNNEVIPVK